MGRVVPAQGRDTPKWTVEPKPTYAVKPATTDNVNHPKHYTSHPSGVECIQITEHYNFCVGNAIKYVWRAGLKSEVGSDPVEKQIEDLNKAIWYLRREVERLAKDSTDSRG